MTKTQKIIRFIAVALAVCLTINIFTWIVSLVALISGIDFKKDMVSKETTDFTVSDGIKNLDIEISAADLVIVSGENFSLSSNLKYLSVSENGDTLRVFENRKLPGNRSGATLTLTVPMDRTLGRIEISTGASRLTADKLSAERISLDLGAGAVTLSEITSTVETEINGGTGNIVIGGGSLRDAEIDIGVGKLTLKAELLGDTNIDCGVGSTEIVVLGTKEDYRVEIDKGLGSATFDGIPMSDGVTYGNGSNKIDIDSGVGSMNLSFSEKTPE